MAAITPSTVDVLSLGSVKGTLATFTSTCSNNDYWTSKIPGIIMVIPMIATGVGFAMSWTASSGTIFFKPSVTTESVTALVLSKSF